MTTPPVSLLAPTASAPGSAATKAAGTSAPLSQNDFMKLLMAQMQHQNPLEPMSNTDFTAQLAQFSTLSGIQTLNANFSDMLMVQQLSQGANLIGKQITYNVQGKAAPGSGTVDSVAVKNGKLELQVGKDSVPLAQVLGLQGVANGK